MIAFSIPPLPLELLDGDIAAEKVDAVVNAANTALWMGAGVAGALKARHVIHAAVMGQDLRTSAPFIARATASALALAERNGCRSIAFPAFGTGVGGFPAGQCARIMIGAVASFAAAAGTVRLVRFVLFGQAAYRAFAETAGELLGPPLDGPADCPLSS
jgi:O-acetyl-ADP-ribose deacetylase (regulator of RNase III)